MTDNTTGNKADSGADISSIFRAYDIRGIYPDAINEKIVHDIGAAYANRISTGMEKEVKQIIVAHDVRLTSPQLALEFIKGVASVSSVKIAFAGLLPLGVAMFHAHKTDSELVYITASHLTAEWNGIKFFHPTGVGWMEDETRALRDSYIGQIEQISPTEQITADQASSVEQIEHSEQVRQIEHTAHPVVKSFKEDHKHTVIDPDTIIANYNRHIMTKIRPAKRLRVVIDCGNGAASVVAPKLFSLGGFDVKALWAQPDGRFPNRSPDPHTDPLTRLKEAVRSERASLGIAYDGDGDRMAIIDDKGETLTPERISYFILSEILKTSRGPIIANVECTRLIDDIAAKFNHELIRVPVGHTYLVEAALKHNASFGIEVSGHYMLPALLPFDDALAISYYLACILARNDKPLSSIVSEMPTYPFERINFVCDDDKKFEIINKMKLKLAQDHKINDMDGLRLDFEDGWILIRASNTGPKIRLTVEANTPERFEQLKSEYTAMLERELHEFYKPSFITKLKKLFGK